MLIIRTDAVDEHQLRLAARVAAVPGFAVVFVFDDGRVAGSAFTDFFSIPISVEYYRSIGLYAESDALWRCGDYCIISARRHFPLASYFWMVERDVFINTDDYAEFFRSLENIEHYDFVASRLYPANASWAWRETMSRLTDATPYQCFFPVSGMTGRGADILSTRRFQAGLIYSQIPTRDRKLWPNDEVFCATEMNSNGLKASDMAVDGVNCYTRDTLRLRPPISLRRMIDQKRDNMFYHPVLRGDEFKDKLLRRFGADTRTIKSSADLRKIYNRSVVEDAVMECGETFGEEFQRLLDEAVGRLAIPS